jgi:hypothetical protein
MSLYDSDRRYRRRFWGGLTRFVIGAGLFSATAIVAYQVGIEDLDSRVHGYQEAIYDLETRQGLLEQENADLRLSTEQARLAVEEWERRYAADVPDGERRRMLDLVTERLDGGLSADRLAFLIRSADEARDCEPTESKRFLVQTPLHDGRNTTVSFASDAIVVTATGVSARTSDGRPQAAFDPAEPVTVRITRIDGEILEVAGVLPMQESMVHGGKEYRLQLRAGDAGFVQVAAERCAYP